MEWPIIMVEVTALVSLALTTWLVWRERRKHKPLESRPELRLYHQNRHACAYCGRELGGTYLSTGGGGVIVLYCDSMCEKAAVRRGIRERIGCVGSHGTP